MKRNKKALNDNGRTNYNTKYNKLKVKEHILEPEEYDKMVADYLKSNPIKVVNYDGEVIEEKWEEIK